MPRVGAGAGDGLSTGAAPALLGAQDAEYLREGTAPRRKAGQDPGAEDLLGRECCCRAAGLCAVPLSLAVPLPGDDPPTGARSAGVVALLRLSTTPVAEAAHHQRDRTLFRRRPATDTTHGGVHQRGKRGSDYLCDFQSVQRGLEKPHPRTIYTSSLTSPSHPMAFFSLHAPKTSKMMFHFNSGRGERIRDQPRSQGRSIRRAKSGRERLAELSSGRAARRLRFPAQSQSESLLASRPSRTRDTPRTNPRPRP